jgi:nucleoredoxin
MEGVRTSFGNDLINKDGPVDGSSLDGAKLIGIYFSAHWCPPCRQFTPVLANFYNKVNENGKVLEIVFVSSDNDEKSFKEYLATMPWISLKLGSEESEKLGDHYKVSGIPRLVIIKPDGTVVDQNGRKEITTNGEKAYDLWLTK